MAGPLSNLTGMEEQLGKVIDHIQSNPKLLALAIEMNEAGQALFLEEGSTECPYWALQITLADALQEAGSGKPIHISYNRELEGGPRSGLAIKNLHEQVIETASESQISAAQDVERSTLGDQRMDGELAFQSRGACTPDILRNVQIPKM